MSTTPIVVVHSGGSLVLFPAGAATPTATAPIALDEPEGFGRALTDVLSGLTRTHHRPASVRLLLGRPHCRISPVEGLPPLPSADLYAAAVRAHPRRFLLFDGVAPVIGSSLVTSTGSAVVAVAAAELVSTCVRLVRSADLSLEVIVPLDWWAREAGDAPGTAAVPCETGRWLATLDLHRAPHIAAGHHHTWIDARAPRRRRALGALAITLALLSVAPIAQARWRLRTAERRIAEGTLARLAGDVAATTALREALARAIPRRGRALEDLVQLARALPADATLMSYRADSAGITVRLRTADVPGAVRAFERSTGFRNLEVIDGLGAESDSGAVLTMRLARRVVGGT